MNADNPPLDQAFTVLKSYNRGSHRGDLTPIDDAVVEALKHSGSRKKLESRLTEALAAGGSVVASEYVCSKLVLVGTAASVPALAALLDHPELSTAARNALEAIPGSQPSKALRKSLAHTSGLARIGVINSLANRREPDAVNQVSKLLNDPDDQTAAAAANALGRIGSAKAADCLMRAFPECRDRLRVRFTDALLVCGEALGAGGDAGRAARIRAILNATSPR